MAKLTLKEIQEKFPIGTVYYPTNATSKRTIKTNNFKLVTADVWCNLDENGKSHDSDLSFCVYDGSFFAKILSRPQFCEIY